MAYRIVQKEFNPNTGKNLVEIVLDSDSDLSEVGTDYSPGSIAVVADSGAPSYMLNASEEWKEL